jgi:hypothetical protein
MDTSTNKLEFIVNGEINYITLEPYIIKLKNPFGTSHSLTTSRHNALLTVYFQGEYGFGECGLPPKKPHCYYSDYEDIQ